MSTMLQANNQSPQKAIDENPSERPAVLVPDRGCILNQGSVNCIEPEPCCREWDMCAKRARVLHWSLKCGQPGPKRAAPMNSAWAATGPSCQQSEHATFEIIVLMCSLPLTCTYFLYIHIIVFCIYYFFLENKSLRCSIACIDPVCMPLKTHPASRTDIILQMTRSGHFT